MSAKCRGGGGGDDKGERGDDGRGGGAASKDDMSWPSESPTSGVESEIGGGGGGGVAASSVAGVESEGRGRRRFESVSAVPTLSLPVVGEFAGSDVDAADSNVSLSSTSGNSTGADAREKAPSVVDRRPDVTADVSEVALEGANGSSHVRVDVEVAPGGDGGSSGDVEIATGSAASIVTGTAVEENSRDAASVVDDVVDTDAWKVIDGRGPELSMKTTSEVFRCF